MIEYPDLQPLAETDAGVEVSCLQAGEPWTVTELAGLQFYNYARQNEVIGEVMPKAGDCLHIVRNPENKYDTNACEVWWRNSFMLGHLPCSLARDVAPLLDAGQPLRGYVYRPGDGEAWSMSALLVGGAVEEWHAAWVRRAVQRAFDDMEWDEYRRWHVGRDHGSNFAYELQERRAERLLSAVNTFIRLPFEAELPAVGSTVDPVVIEAALDISRTTAFKIVRAAGVEPQVHYRGWYADRTTVEITPALYAAMQAWCAAPRTRVTRDQMAHAVDRARDSHYRPLRNDDDAPF